MIVFKIASILLQNKGFAVSHLDKSYWYVELENKAVTTFDLNNYLRFALISKYNLIFKFGKNTIEVTSAIRMNIFILDNDIQQAMISCFQYIGQLFEAIHSYILGDNHALYFEHQQSCGKFRNINRLAKKMENERKDNIKDMYIELENSYDLEGFYKLIVT